MTGVMALFDSRDALLAAMSAAKSRRLAPVTAFSRIRDAASPGPPDRTSSMPLMRFGPGASFSYQAARSIVFTWVRMPMARSWSELRYESDF